MATFTTDAKHTAKLGIPTYGFSPLRLRPDDQFLDLFHGVDERVSIEGLRFGLPVLYDVVRTLLRHAGGLNRPRAAMPRAAP